MHIMQTNFILKIFFLFFIQSMFFLLIYGVKYDIFLIDFEFFCEIRPNKYSFRFFFFFLTFSK